jgi:hypothetical protein
VCLVIQSSQTNHSNPSKDDGTQLRIAEHECRIVSRVCRPFERRILSRVCRPHECRIVSRVCRPYECRILSRVKSQTPRTAQYAVGSNLRSNLRSKNPPVRGRLLRRCWSGSDWLFAHLFVFPDKGSGVRVWSSPPNVVVQRLENILEVGVHSHSNSVGR